ncbi:hypothetical protein CFN79_18475 [Chromobacterium vaccinii]|nr:hypothetical protein CFN79_18475 [Chromobacterium vaccinii]
MFCIQQIARQFVIDTCSGNSKLYAICPFGSLFICFWVLRRKPLLMPLLYSNSVSCSLAAPLSNILTTYFQSS